MFAKMSYTSMKKYFALILLLTVTTISFAQKQIVTKSSVTFKIKNLGITVDGSFGDLNADISFDPANLNTAAINAAIDANSINTGNDSRDEHLRSDSYFDAAKFPKISMKLVTAKHKNGNNYSGTFSLTIKDKTRQIEMPFTYTENGNTASFTGSFKIKRTDYGVGSSSMIMSDDVTILITLETGK